MCTPPPYRAIGGRNRFQVGVRRRTQGVQWGGGDLENPPGEPVQAAGHVPEPDHGRAKETAGPVG